LSDGSLLSHDADLLRERRTPRRECLHDRERDALARWHRLIGDETKFLTGTDEHGQKVADAAAKNGQSPQEWTDAKSQQFRDAWAALDIHYDDFIRTTEPRHYESVQKFLTAIYDNGYIYKDVYKGLYCVSCEDYYTIETSVDGKCPIHGRDLIEMEEENWFFASARSKNS